MFDFPQPGEIYRSAGFPDVAVVGILEDGIPWEMPYRCSTLARMLAFMYSMLMAVLFLRGCCFKVFTLPGRSAISQSTSTSASSSRCGAPW